MHKKAIANNKNQIGKGRGKLTTDAKMKHIHTTENNQLD